MARILITWGLVATLTAFVWNPLSLYVMRFGLGVAEAGFMPGVVLYLTYWFPSRYRARAVAGNASRPFPPRPRRSPVTTENQSRAAGTRSTHRSLKVSAPAREEH